MTADAWVSRHTVAWQCGSPAPRGLAGGVVFAMTV